MSTKPMKPRIPNGWVRRRTGSYIRTGDREYSWDKNQWAVLICELSKAKVRPLDIIIKRKGSP